MAKKVRKPKKSNKPKAQKPAPSAKTSSDGYGKSYAAGAAGAVATIIAFAYQKFSGGPLPAEIVAAVQTLVTAAAVFLTPQMLRG